MSSSTRGSRLPLAVIALSLLATPTLSGCVTHHHHGHDTHVVRHPPRYAEHGYTHHYHDVVLVFDDSWHGYAVRGRPHHYFYVDHFYRWHGGGWESARRLGGPWIVVKIDSVPPRLVHHHTHSRQREAVREWREVEKERRDERHDAARERRDERREAVHERREEQREAARELHDERREPARERREVEKERRDEHHDAARERRDESRAAARERREERREVAEGRRDERSSGSSDGSPPSGGGVTQ